jgi:hypothetical protein
VIPLVSEEIVLLMFSNPDTIHTVNNRPTRQILFGSPYARISNAIIRRINYPKQRGEAANWNNVRSFHISRRAALEAKARPLLTPEEQQDVQQTVAFVLAERGVLPDQKLSLGKDGDWRAVFSAVREMLGIDKRARSKRRFVACEEVPAETLRCEPLPVFVDSPSERRELNASYRQRLARHYGYARSLAFAAFTADRTRTRKSTYHKVIRTLAAHIRAAFREIGQPLFEGVSEDARFVRDLRLRKYLANGEAILTAEALRPPTRFERTGFQAEAFANF